MTTDSKLREMELRFQELKGPAKIRALLCGRGIQLSEVAEDARTYPMHVTRELDGTGSPKSQRVRNAFARKLEVSRDEVDAALAEAA